MNSYFKAILAFLTLPAFLFITPAHAVLVDLSGVSVNGGAPTIINVNEDELLSPGFQIGFWFEVEHFGSSFQSETQITLTNSFHGVDYVLNGAIDCGLPGSPGVGECDAFITVNEDSFPGDVWTIQLADTFDDGLNPDHTFGAGSLIAWGDDFDAVFASKVPAPATLALLGLGLVGFAMWRRVYA